MASFKRWTVGVAVLLLLLAAMTAEAQWVMAGRAVANRVRQMTQKSDKGGYDVATVILEAASARVYETAVKVLKNHPEITITKQDDQKGKLEFRKGDMVAGLQITPLGEKLSQLLIASSTTEAKQASATPLVVENVLRVCREMKVECTVQAE